MSESYFFAVVPRYLKVEHAFAKTIKPNTKYRIIIFKGIQKCDQMKQAIKCKLVGGKIDLQSPQLFFNLPYYSPAKNIQFTIKLYETKPNEEQTQIASYAILSSDFIKTYKSQKQTSHTIEGQLQQDLSVGFDLFIQKSKSSLSQAILKAIEPTSKSTKQIQQQNKSVSGKSKQLIRQGEGFISPSRRLQRKRGHQGRLRSRNGSRERSQNSVQGSVTSSRRKWKKSSPSEKEAHFLHSPKKASPPKIGLTTQSQKAKSIPKSDASKSIGKQSQTQSNVEVNEKSYKYQPSSTNKLKYIDTKEIFDIKIQKSDSPQKNNTAKSNLVKPTIADNKSPATRSQVVNSPPTSQSKIPAQNISAKSQILPKKEPVTSPRNSKVNADVKESSNLQFQSTTKVFDVVHKNAVSPRSQQPKSPGKYEPTKIPKVPTYATKTQEVSAPANSQKQLIGSKSQKSLQPNKQKLQASSSLNDSKGTKKLEQSNIKIVMQGSVHSPAAQLIQEVSKSIASKGKNKQSDDKSISIKGDIQVKNKPVKRINDEIHKSSTLKGSLRLKQAVHDKEKQQAIKQQAKSAQQLKMKIIYMVFLVVSMFLIYQAMSPTRRV